MKNALCFHFGRTFRCDFMFQAMQFLGLATLCYFALLFNHTDGFAQPGSGRPGFPGGGGPGGAFPGGGPGGGNMAGRPGFPGGGGPGGAFPGGANMAGRPGFPGGGGPGGAFPGIAVPQRQASATTTSTPLVPAFGVTAAATPGVLRFGEFAETVPTSTPARYAGNTAESDLQQRINEQVQQLMNRFDRDKNGIIENSTGEWRNISIDAHVADTNRDGRITMDELRVYVGNQLRGGTSGAKVFTSYATTYEHMPEGIPIWFTERDKDNDGQLTLFEYANGQPITETMLAEFEWLDLNNDGIATLAECYSAIKTKEEMERKAQEEQGIAQGGNARGGNPTRGNPPVGRAGNNNAGGSFTPSADQNSGSRNNSSARPDPNANNRPRGNNPGSATAPGGQRLGGGNPGPQGGNRPARNGG